MPLNTFSSFYHSVKKIVDRLWMYPKLFHILICIPILAIGIFFRFAYLAELPNGLNWDETAYGYNAYSLLKTGKDEWGVPYPVFIKSFGEYKPALLSYLIIPLLQLFSNWQFAVRFAPAFLNSLSLVALYFLIFSLSGSRRLGFLSSFVLAISPWHIHFSRVALDPSIAFPFLIFGMLAWIHHNRVVKSIGSILLVLSMYTYNAERIFMPLLLLSYWSVYWHGKYRENLIKNILPVGIVVFGSIWIIGLTLFGNAGNRLRTASFIFSEKWENTAELKDIKAESIGIEALNWLNHPLLELGSTVFHKYGLYFRPDFLFFSESGMYGSVLAFTKRGNFLEIFSIFFVLGLAAFVRKPEKVGTFFLLWLLFSPIAGAITPDSPHSGRALVMTPALSFFIGLGVMFTLKLIQARSSKKVMNSVFFMLIGVFSIFAVSYWREFLLSFPEDSEYFWQGYYREMSLWTESQRFHYDRVMITNHQDVQTLIFYAWYNRFDPAAVQSGTRGGSSPMFITGFSNVEMLDSRIEPLACAFTQEKTLLVVHPSEVKTLQLQTAPIKSFQYYNRFGTGDTAFVAYDTNLLTERENDRMTFECELSTIRKK